MQLKKKLEILNKNQPLIFFQEHIHVYQSSEEEEGGNFAAPFHTDSGILLLLTPFQEHPLKVNILPVQCTLIQCRFQNYFQTLKYFIGIYISLIQGKLFKLLG